MDIKVPETRGRKPIRDFSKMKPGDKIEIQRDSKQAYKIIACARKWAKRKGLDWEFRSFSTSQGSFIVRVL